MLSTLNHRVLKPEHHMLGILRPYLICNFHDIVFFQQCLEKHGNLRREAKPMLCNELLHTLVSKLLCVIILVGCERAWAEAKTLTALRTSIIFSLGDTRTSTAFLFQSGASPRYCTAWLNTSMVVVSCPSFSQIFPF